jgi:hypothetical protein
VFDSLLVAYLLDNKLGQLWGSVEYSGILRLCENQRPSGYDFSDLLGLKCYKIV